MGAPLSLQPLREWKPGDSITAQHLNEVIRRVNQLAAGVAPPRQIVQANVPAVRQFKIVSQDADYLKCNAYDGVASGDLVYYVAKPYLLRRTPFDGESRAGIEYEYSSDSARVADDGVDTEDQTIVPSYQADDIVYAIMGIAGGTSERLDSDESGGETEPRIMWVDLNVDGRAWCKVAE